MRWLDRQYLYWQLLSLSPRGFERRVKIMLEHKDQLPDDRRAFLQSPAFLEYWREHFAHTWVVVSEHGRAELGTCGKREALELFGRAYPRGRILFIDEIDHWIFYSTRESS